MKQKLLIKELKTLGYYLKCHGANHDIYTNGNKIIPIPRHKEINELTAAGILKEAKK